MHIKRLQILKESRWALYTPDVFLSRDLPLETNKYHCQQRTSYNIYNSKQNLRVFMVGVLPGALAQYIFLGEMIELNLPYMNNDYYSTVQAIILHFARVILKKCL